MYSVRINGYTVIYGWKLRRNTTDEMIRTCINYSGDKNIKEKIVTKRSLQSLISRSESVLNNNGLWTIRILRCRVVLLRGEEVKSWKLYTTAKHAYLKTDVIRVLVLLRDDLIEMSVVFMSRIVNGEIFHRTTSIYIQRVDKCTTNAFTAVINDVDVIRLCICRLCGFSWMCTQMCWIEICSNFNVQLNSRGVRE